MAMAECALSDLAKAATTKGEKAGEFVELAFANIGKRVERAGDKIREDVKTSIADLQKTLGKDGKMSCSLGRNAASKEELSTVAKKLQELLDETTDLGNAVKQSGLRDYVVNIRDNVINKCEADQEFTLAFMKTYLEESDDLAQRDINAYAKAVKELKSKMAKARRSTNVDFPCVHDMMTSSEDGVERGRLYNRASKQAKRVRWGCAYSRFLERGELEAARLYAAADFVAGRRRRSPRGKTYGNPECQMPDGSFKFSDAQKSPAANYMGKVIIKNIGSDSEVSRFARLANWAGVNEDVLKTQEATDIMQELDDPIFQWKKIGREKQTAESASGSQPVDDPSLAQEAGGQNGKPNVPDKLLPNSRMSYDVPRSANDSANELLFDLAEVSTKPLEDQVEDELEFYDIEDWPDDEPVPERDGKIKQAKRKVVDATKKPGFITWSAFKNGFMNTLTWVIKTGWPVFFVYETFLAMSHEKSGCYLEYLTKDSEVRGMKTKVCDSVTWGHGPFTYFVNEGIKVNCDCRNVYDTTVLPRWRPEDPPTNLINNGCTDLGDPIKKQCRASLHSAGYNYIWDNTSWFDCLFNTLKSFTDDTSSCIQCLTKIADLALGGGIASIFGIVLILCIVWVIMWIYRNFFAGVASSGGDGSSGISLSSTGAVAPMASSADLLLL